MIALSRDRDGLTIRRGMNDCARGAAAYVLGPMEPGEAAEFERHMGSCRHCRDEVDELLGAAAALPLIGRPVEPSPEAAVPAPAAATTTRPVRSKPSEPSPRRIRRGLAKPVPRPVAAGVGAVLVAGLLTVGISRLPGGTRYVPARTVWHDMRAAVRVNGEHGTLLVAGMPAPPAGTVYELWLERAHRAPAPTATQLVLNQAGEAAVTVPGRLSGVRTVIVADVAAAGNRDGSVPKAVVVAKLP